MNKFYSFLIDLYQKLQKSWKYLKVVITFVIWIAIAYFVFYEKEQFLQILTNSHLEWKWVAFSSFFLILNIGLEAFKWFLMIKIFHPSISYRTAYQAILTGSASAFITPQKIGDYIGRLLYLTTENRISAIFATLLDRFAQLGATLIFAVFAFYKLEISFFPYTALLTLLTVLFHILLWTSSHSISYLSVFFKQIQFLKDISIKIPFSLQVFTSFLSIIRFSVFLTQYILIFKAFGIQQEKLWALCCLTFFIKSFIPSLAFSELGIREGVAIWVFNQYSSIDAVIVFQATFILFIINTLMPAAVGAWLIKNVNI